MTTAPPNTASLYVRLSREAQAENLSKDGMIADCRRIAADQGLTVLEPVHVDDGISGAVRNRPEFLAWLADGREGRAPLRQDIRWNSAAGRVRLPNMTRATWPLNAEDTLALPVDALGLLILRNFMDSNGWNWANWMNEVGQFGGLDPQRKPTVLRAMSEAWQWLLSTGLVARDPSQGSHDAVFVTRRGNEILTLGVERLRAGQRLSTDLHPAIATTVQRQFLLGEWELAAFAAMKEVEVSVRLASGLPNSEIGTRLMRKAFGDSGPLRNADLDGGEQNAIADLLAGAIGLFKNPSSHRPVN